MTVSWSDGQEPEPKTFGMADKLRVVRRGILIIAVILVSLLALLVLRLPERAFYGRRRPLTPYIVQFVCRTSLFVLGIKITQHGQPMTQAGAVVSNHTSWLDILVLNAEQQVFFVSKDEVANWPGIGVLARVTGTMFVVRDRAHADKQTAMLTRRLKAGHRMLFFPEGTSTDGLRVLPFKPTLFEAFLAPGLPDETYIQCISAVFHAPPGEDPRFYGWWGDMSFGTHLLMTLAQKQQGSVEITYHPPTKVWDHGGRKALAAFCEAEVRSVHHRKHRAIEDQAAVMSK
ncbi:lysophospholipid acyltransferase family protein [Ascidiaceihabitans sp.]|uniref:lysophospholipid acyltransferase family protein n=1 Tax=Ascidiaceihabitans sp. TaxID=1872644 RepID=UPI0032977D89